MISMEISFKDLIIQMMIKLETLSMLLLTQVGIQSY